MNHLRNNDRPKYSNNNDVILYRLYSVPALNYVTYPRMEGNSCDKVNMLETTKTLFTRDMPQAIKNSGKKLFVHKTIRAHRTVLSIDADNKKKFYNKKLR